MDGFSGRAMKVSSFPVWNVKEFGASGDKQVKDDDAIQKAIDACHNEGGGTVYIPPGDYLAGAIHLRSNVTLHLEGGATLWASVHKEDYPEGRAGLIMGEDAHNVAVVGRGKLNGQGQSAFKAPSEIPPFRPLMILLVQCRNVLIEGITLEYASSWTVHLLRCDTVNIRGVNITNNMDRYNTDGIDPDCCKNVHISDCHIVAGDDCIVLKSTQEHPLENITVTNCTLETTCAALKLGTESRGDMRHCIFSNCVIRNTKVPIAFYMKDGTTMEDMVFSNITMETESFEDRVPSRGPGEYPIFMNIERRYPDSKIGRIRNVIFRDLIIETSGRCFIEGSQDQPIENLTMENVTFTVRGYEDSSKTRKQRGGRGSKETWVTTYEHIPAYFMFAHVKGLTLRNLQLRLRSEEPLEKRFALCGDHMEDVEIDGFKASVPDGELPLIQLNNSRNVAVRNCALPNALASSQPSQ